MQRYYKKNPSLTFFRTGARGLIQHRKRKTDSEVGSNALSPILKMTTIQRSNNYYMREMSITHLEVCYIYTILCTFAKHC